MPMKMKPTLLKIRSNNTYIQGKYISIIFNACVLGFLNIACQNPQPSKLDAVLEYADENRLELEKVLAHYSRKAEDSLKLRAAEFLIKNMPYHYTMEGPTLTAYYHAVDSINKLYTNVWDCFPLYDSLYTTYGDPKKDIVVKEDVKHIKSEYLIHTIDHAFKQWKEGLWAKHLSFDDFCEYLLPYRVTNENVEYWRDTLENRYKHRLLWVEDTDIRNTAYWAALHLNDEIRKNGFFLKKFLPSAPVNHPASVLNSMKTGNCEDYAYATAYVMRACGIPVSVDFIFQWPFRSQNHTWNVLLDDMGRRVPFMGAENNPGYPDRPGHRRAKVYRFMYGYQEESLFAHKEDEEVPPHLNTPFIKDVSDDYFQGVDVVITLPENEEIKKKFAYLAVFDNQKWMPVQWGKIQPDRKVCFKKMEKNIVYQPVYYVDGKIEYAANPILVDLDGTVKELKPDTTQHQTLIAKRKYPLVVWIYRFSDRMVNGKFQASNHPGFKNAVDAGTILRHPVAQYDTLHSLVNTPYRYWRYLSPEWGHTNVAELEFFFQGKKITPTGRILTNSEHTAENKKENAFDKDGLTFYESTEPSEGWIGMDFGKPVTVDYFRYLPRNDDNNVVAGQKYELFYFDKNEWKSLPGVVRGTDTLFYKLIAQTDSLIYPRVPVNALFLLKNHTTGTEERVFTYENGRQVFW